MNETPNSAALLTASGRVLLALIFVVAGYMKIVGYAGTAAYMTSRHVPSILLPLVIALELGGGIALAIGFLTRLIAGMLALFSFLAIVLFLLPPTSQQGFIMILAELAMIGGLLDFAARGAGPVSVDALRERGRH